MTNNVQFVEINSNQNYNHNGDDDNDSDIISFSLHIHKHTQAHTWHEFHKYLIEIEMAEDKSQFLLREERIFHKKSPITCQWLITTSHGHLSINYWKKKKLLIYV